MGILLQQGRDFDAHDNATSGDVAVVNETMARHYWPKSSAIGGSVIVDKRPRRIVGIVHDYAYRTLTTPIPRRSSTCPWHKALQATATSLSRCAPAPQPPRSYLSCVRR